MKCCSKYPNAFWHVHKHEVELPLKKDFNGKLRRSKAIPMNQEQLTLQERDQRTLTERFDQKK